MITIDGDFKGSMLGSGRVEKNIAFIELKKDPITRGYIEDHDYNLHFHFMVRNNGDVPVNVKFCIGCNDKEDLNKDLGWLWIKNKDQEKYIKVEIDGRMFLPGKYRFELKIAPGSTFISNYIPLDHEVILESIREKALKGGAHETSIGKTVEGKDITVFEYVKEKGSPYLLFLSGFHPPENDLIALEAIAEILAERNLKDGSRDHFNIALIPIVNPDGYLHNTQGSNINGINFYWKFFGNTNKECPESHHIWNYCKRIKPLFYMDFHAFTFQGFEPRPYNIPPFIHDKNKRSSLQLNINKSLSKECDADYKWIHRFLIPVKIISPNLISTRLINEMGTLVSPKFHMHLKYGVDESKDLVKRCFKEILRILTDDRKNLRSENKIGSNTRYKVIFGFNKLIYDIMKK